MFALDNLILVFVGIRHRFRENLLTMNVVLVSLVKIVCGSHGDNEQNDRDQVDRAYRERIQRLILLDLDPRRVDFKTRWTKL